jgi:hypothetical protein
MTTIDLGMPTYNISNSEAGAFLSCERMWVFNFGMQLAPIDQSVPLARGTLGHLYFQYYVEYRLANGGAIHTPTVHKEAMAYAQKAFKEAIDSGTSIELVMETQFLVERYMNYHNGWPAWELLGTEQRRDMQITETINLPIRYDLYFYDHNRKRFIIADYKFTYDFWSLGDHNVNAQMPKYVAVMKAAGERVDEGLLIQIRTRPLGKEKSADPNNLWKEWKYDPSRSRIRSMIKQHVQASLRIEKFKQENQTVEEMLDSAIALFNKHGSCKYCPFKMDLCNSTTEGKKDLSVDIREGYTHNTYGYNGMPAGELI